MAWQTLTQEIVQFFKTSKEELDVSGWVQGANESRNRKQ